MRLIRLIFLRLRTYPRTMQYICAIMAADRASIPLALILYIYIQSSFGMSRKLKEQPGTNFNELTTIIEKELKTLSQKVKQASKLNGQQKISTLDKINRNDIKIIKHQIESLESAISMQEDQEEFGTAPQLKQLHQSYLRKLDAIKKDLDYFKTQRIREGALYQDRGPAIGNAKEEYALKIQEAQKESENSVKNMLRMLYQTKQIANTVNIQLERQIEQLDSVNQNLRDTESTMQRAIRHIEYFGRAIYTDKLLLGLMVLIILAVIAIIILSAIGKIPAPSKDVLT